MLLSDQQPIDLNIKFKGSYELLCWILKKYKNELPYNGYIGHFATANNYYFTCSKEWKRYGVNYKVWNLLHKDLTIAYLMNKIEIANLNELQKIYNNNINNVKLYDSINSTKHQR